MSERQSTSSLPLPVRDVLPVHLDEEAVQRIHRGVRRRRQRAPRRLQPALLGLAAAALLATVFGAYQVFGGSPPDAPGPLRLADGSLPARFSAASSMDAPAERTVLSDGSAVYVAATSELSTLENTGQSFVVHLRQGVVELDVVPDGPRRWTVECGEVSVQVVGTRFRVDRTDERIVVSVDRGAVLVRGERVPDRVQRLSGGQDLTIRLVDLPAGTVTPEVVHTPALEGETAAGVEPPSETVTPSEAQARSSWRELARQGSYDEAYEQLGSEGLSEETRRASVQELLALADVARLSGHPAEAVAPLARLLSEHSSTPHAPLAAFTLGRVHMDNLGRPAEAADALEQAIGLGLPDNLRADALARLAEAHRRCGDRAAARLAAARYLASFPDGHRVEAMRTIVGAREEPR